MRNFVLGIVAAIVLLPIGLLACFVLGFTGFRSDTVPSRLESLIMNATVRATIKRRAPQVANPFGPSNQAVIEGGKLYVAGCAGCHGKLGKPAQHDLTHFPPVPQLPYLGAQYTEPELYWIVKHGVRMSGMSAYGPFYSDQQLWELADFLHNVTNLRSDVLGAIYAK